MSKHICQYRKECPVFQGKVATNGTPLAIYKNVFCNRGIKGWSNCEQYLEYNVNARKKIQVFMLKTDKNIDNINISQEEAQVLLLLEEKGKCLFGNIFKELNMSYTKGAEIILSLTNKGYIRNAGRSSYYELAID